jgi:hypothetical protein
VVTKSLEATHKKRDAAVLQWLRRWRERDDRRLAGPRSLEHVDPLGELIRVVTKRKIATPDELRLYDLHLGERPFFSQPRRPE